MNQITKLTSDTKVILQSDNLYLPRLSANGVPVYDSLNTSNHLLLLKSFEAVVPFYFLATTNHPGPTILSAALFYFGIYRVINW